MISPDTKKNSWRDPHEPLVGDVDRQAYSNGEMGQPNICWETIKQLLFVPYMKGFLLDYSIRTYYLSVKQLCDGLKKCQSSFTFVLIARRCIERWAQSSQIQLMKSTFVALSKSAAQHPYEKLKFDAIAPMQPEIFRKTQFHAERLFKPSKQARSGCGNY